jgi:uncharacterized protein YwgA
MDHVIRISLILQKLGPIKGEKNFQKLIYLLQSHGDDIGYKFRWNIFGPVSFKLESDINEAITMGFIQKEKIEGVSQFRSKIDDQKSDFWRERIANIDLSEKLDVKITSVTKLLEHSRKYPNQIEILASVDFLKNNKGLSYEEAKNDFKSIIGKRFTKSEINESLRLLDAL